MHFRARQPERTDHWLSTLGKCSLAALAFADVIADEADVGSKEVVIPFNSEEEVSARFFTTTGSSEIRRQFEKFVKEPRPRGPESDLDSFMRRLLAEKYDCPKVNSKVAARLKKPVFLLSDLYEKMTAAERSECDTEGTQGAVDRVIARLQDQPQRMLTELAAALPYLEARSKLIATQCESDLMLMNQARDVAIDASVAESFTGEDLYWDLARIVRKGASNSLPQTISDKDISLQVKLTPPQADEEPATLQVNASGLPPPKDPGFEWKITQYVVTDQLGYSPIQMIVSSGDIVVPEVGLDPLPLSMVRVAASWEREPHSNISEGTYTASWQVPDGHHYCRHDVNVWSENNVCKNFLETSYSGIRVEAVLKSGSKYVDGWRGWLRFRGSLTGIDKNATRCQKGRAMCTSFGDSGPLVQEDNRCHGPAAEPVREECFREGPLGNEICHYGTRTPEGRCQVDEIRPCY